MIKLILPAVITFTLSGCAQFGLQNTIGCLEVSLDGPTTDSTASGNLVKLPDGYTLSPGEANTLIPLCDQE